MSQICKTAALLACILASDAWADMFHMELRALRDQAGAIQDAQAEQPPPPWLTPAPHQVGVEAGHALGQEAARSLPGLVHEDLQAAAALPQPPEVQVTLLVSRQLGEATLRAIFSGAAQSETPTRVVFRGILPGESLIGFIRQVHTWLDGIDPPPLVELDPIPFQETGARLVPLMVLSDADGEIARVAGLTDPGWLLEQVAAGRGGDLGTRGPVTEISEPDMIEEIQRRLATLDLDALRQGAVERFWQRTEMTELPAATAARVRHLDATTELQADLHDADGQVIFPAGTRFNPFEHADFTLRLILFDATDPRQVAIAEDAGANMGGRRPVFIASRLNREAGWDALAALEEVLDEPVYLLTPDVRRRFAIEAVPTVVEADGGRFRITEIPVDVQ